VFLPTPDEPGIGGPRAELTRRSLLTSTGLAGLLTACGNAPDATPDPSRSRRQHGGFTCTTRQ
jgi:hypothetical protein